MDRLFKRSDSAKYFYLNKMWEFVTDPEKKGEKLKYYRNFPENSRKMVVPSGRKRARAFQIYRNGVVQDVFLFRKRKYLS